MKMSQFYLQQKQHCKEFKSYLIFHGWKINDLVELQSKVQELKVKCFLMRGRGHQRLRAVWMEVGQTQSLNHHNVNVQFGDVMKDQCEEKSHMHHSEEEFIHLQL